eukprot:CAMPEP_0194058046 /NCGR_PEP_ID=MMETSP0009_2-20130614/65051_1 /TAXON_ID=210454 /ORGANISM="Grammatophora oceanica, Strain CCMP 410" /LENGTH=60 /DNA_ID=CAMNT_0038708029 /DNA_START=350 /DNA_END=532 /DNA_ORIENTATION=+
MDDDELQNDATAISAAHNDDAWWNFAKHDPPRGILFHYYNIVHDDNSVISNLMRHQLERS